MKPNEMRMEIGIEHSASRRSRALFKRRARMPKGSHKVWISWIGTWGSSFQSVDCKSRLIAVKCCVKCFHISIYCLFTIFIYYFLKSLSFCIFSWCHFNDVLSNMKSAGFLPHDSEIIPSRPGLMKHGVLHGHIEKRGASGLQLKAVRSIIHLLIPEVSGTDPLNSERRV